ncbi:MAG: hypothetical protein AOA66_0925 [Candidatus Bathyarchaeota archaeon BA2]|nr:MAG: hypothetical protein AOA66_0925 [Candidatus Bathyarchaeota archaeon BA2]
MNVRKVSIIATLTALCVATNYALVGVPNVKVMDFIIFIGGFCFGPFTGALIGALSWIVYGLINPYGFLLPIYLATMFAESIYGIVGGLIGKSLASIDFKGQHLRLCTLFGIFACMLTLIYDIVTNIVFAVTFSIPIVLAVIFGVPFMFIHVFSNIAIFSLGSIPLITAMRKILK